MTRHRTARPPDPIRVRRSPRKGRYDRAMIDAILDRALVAHVAFFERGEPVCIPMLCARIDGTLSIHGSRVAFGRFRGIEDAGERLSALAAFIDKVLPGRWDEVRPPNAKELKGTMILAMEIEQTSQHAAAGAVVFVMRPREQVPPNALPTADYRTISGSLRDPPARVLALVLAELD
jgi:uncharacterized protein